MIQTSPLYYLFMSVVAQVVALGAAMLLDGSDLLPRSFNPLFLQPIFAACGARILKLPTAWQVLNLLLLPGILLFAVVGIPAWVAVLGLFFSLLIYLPTFWTRVPFYPTSNEMYEAILKKLPEDKDFSFIDLGCGYGTMLQYLAERRPRGTFHGSEIAPLPFFVSWLRTLLLRKRMQVCFKSFWKMDFNSFDYVYAFLAPDPMPRLWEKVQSEMKAGSTFLVNSFKVDARADEEIPVQDKRHCVLYLYRR